MKLYEYEAKAILKTYGIPTPRGEIAATPFEAQEVAARLKPPFAVKGQVLVAGRGKKAGGIFFAENIKKVGEVAEKLFSKHIKGSPVKKVLVEEKVSIAEELYLGVTIDRGERKYALIASTLGGMGIEEAAAEAPQSIVKTLIDPQEGFSASDAEPNREENGI